MKWLFYLLFSLTFSCHGQKPVPNIVLINVGSAGREEIAELLNKINPLRPRVIAIDLQFSSDHGEEIDGKLIDALNKCERLVMVSIIDDYSTQRIGQHNFVHGCLPKFTRNAKTGFANLILEEEDSLLRRFSVMEYVDGEEEYSFAMQTAFQFDSAKASRYVLTHSNFNEVNFNDGIRDFKKYEIAKFLKGTFDANIVSGKIVMIGFLGPGIKDKFVAPLMDSTTPNIYGLEFHAQVTTQILLE